MVGSKGGSLRGRPPIPWHVRARRQFWYGAIRQRLAGDEVDYQLDKRYVWEKAPEGRLDYIDGFELFAGIRRNGAVTGQLRHTAKMSLTDVIDYVNADPQFKGTKEFYEASFWDRLAEEDLSIADADNQLAEALKSHRIARVKTLPQQFRTLHPRLAKDSSHETHYRWCLGLTLAELRPLQIPGFLWLLKRLSFHRRNWMFEGEIQGRLDVWFNIVFRQIFDSSIFKIKNRPNVAASEFRECPLSLEAFLAENLDDNPFLGALAHAVEENQSSFSLNYYAEICNQILGEELAGQSENGWSSIEDEAKYLLIPHRILDGGLIHSSLINSAMNMHAAYLLPEIPERSGFLNP